MSENNGILMAEDVELDPSPEPEPPLPRKVVQRERLKLAADMMVLFQADLSPRVSKRVALLAAPTKFETKWATNGRHIWGALGAP